MNVRIARVLTLAVLCCVRAASGDDADVQRSIDSTTDAYSVSRQKLERDAESYVDAANELFINGSYREAARNYAQARLIFESMKDNSEYFRDRLEKTREQIAKSYYYLAQETAMKADEEANANDLTTAIALCREAIEIYPPSKAEMEACIERYEKMRVAAAKRARLSEDQVMPGFADQKYRIAVLLKQAKILYYTRQFEEARRRYQEVLLIDKLNPEAIQGTRAAGEQLRKSAMARFGNTHKHHIAEAAWESVLPVLAKKSVDIRSSAAPTGKAAPAGEVNQLREKLQTIILPRVTFSGDENTPGGTPLPLAVKRLRELSKKFDKSGEGVNIFLYYPETAAGGEGGAQAKGAGEGGGNAGLVGGLGGGEGPGGGKRRAAASDDDDEDDEDSTEQAVDYSRYPVVQLDLVQKPLYEVIDALAQAAQMKYKIEKHAVVLAPKDASLDDMQIKVFSCDANTLAALGGSEDPAGLQEALDGYGVPFPTGAKVMYDARFSSLIVLNTPENLDKINSVLLDMRQQEAPPLVQIQVKFVEVEQNDLKELGFIQTLGRPNGDNGKTYGRLQFDNNDTTLYNSGANTFTYTRSTSGYNYSLAVNMLDQLDSKDVLSAPKVLTDPGQTVTIKMVTERYFKWDYEQVDGATEPYDDNSGDTLVVDPVLWPKFEMKEVGINMTVTPTVDTEKRLIHMTVAPNVTALIGWTTYTYIPEGDNNDSGTASDKEVTISRPIIAERSTRTSVSVADNETIVIGGIIKDFTVTINDKIPFLGDIPLVGELFKSKSTSVQKTNLLIFVTARLLKPDGAPYYQFDSRGRPSSAGAGELY